VRGVKGESELLNRVEAIIFLGMPVSGANFSMLGVLAGF
jgi:hypothetical protein